jgi:hypothetical protein
VKHENLDPLTQTCLDCGATREAQQDNLFPVCVKFEGPHRLALIAIHQAQSRCQQGILWHARAAEEARLQAREAEDAAVYHDKEADRCRAADNELHASSEFLKQASGMKSDTISVGEAIERKYRAGPVGGDFWGG